MTNTFVVKKRINLNFLGEGWEEAFITFTPFTYEDNVTLLKFRRKATQVNAGISQDEDVEEISTEIQTMLSDKFIEGKGFNGTELVDITKKNLFQLPMEAIELALETLQGRDLKKKSE